MSPSHGRDLLPHDRVIAPGATPDRAFIFVHGILGTKANWRGLARKFVRARPEFMAVTVDLPMHGDAQGFEAPWDLELCARELAGLIERIELPVVALSGHSYGGKAVLATERYLQVPERAELMGLAPGRSTALWIFDSPPGTRRPAERSDVMDVITVLRAVGPRHDDRDAFVEAIGGRGLGPSIAAWLAMNLRREDDGSYRFGVDLDAIEAMLRDYLATDAWPWIEAAAERRRVRFVEGARSSVYAAGDRERLRGLAGAGKIAHFVVEAGHWLHAEAPAAVLELLVKDGA